MQRLLSRKRVLLLSTIHPITDPRIVGKIAASLTQNYDVHCALTAQRRRNTKHQQANTTVFPHYQWLWKRLLSVHSMALVCFLRFRPHIVHIFVAELLPLAFIFKWLGAEVIYEVQENLYKKIPIKSHNSGWLYRRLFHYFDRKARHNFKFIFTEKSYLQQYQDLRYPYRIVQNFAATHWLTTNLPTPNLKTPTFFYAGVISYERAFDTLLNALCIVKDKYPNVRLCLFGHLRVPTTILEMSVAYQQVKANLVFHGYLPQDEVFEYAKDALTGIALLKPVGDYADSYPTKLFDYMALGLPVITSDLPLLQAVVEPNKCGFCVSPYHPVPLAEKLIWCIEHPNELKIMGINGRKAVAKMYNWEKEAIKLLEIYKMASG